MTTRTGESGGDKKRLFIAQPPLDVKGYPISNSILLALVQQATWLSLNYSEDVDTKRYLISLAMEYINYFIAKNYYYEDLIVRALNKLLEEVCYTVMVAIIDEGYNETHQASDIRLINGGILITLEGKKLCTT